MIIQMMKQRTGGSDSYIIESLRGFDLFPQTAHVESCVRPLRVSEELSTDVPLFLSVAVLRRQSTIQIDA